MGNSGGNTVMNYLTGGVHLENALVVKRRRGAVDADSRFDGARYRGRNGLGLVDRDQTYNQHQFLQKHKGDQLAAAVDYLGAVIRDNRLLGRLGIYGTLDAGAALTLLIGLQNEIEDVELVGEYGTSLLFAGARDKG